MRKYQVLLGLGVLVMALWAVSAPVHTDGKSLVGGWVWVGCTTPCDGNVWVQCSVDEPFPAVCYDSTWVYVCFVDSYSPTGHCAADEPMSYPCQNGNMSCRSAYDTHCQ